MRMLLIHIDEVEFLDRSESSRPLGVCSFPVGKDVYHDVLIAFVCIETFDTERNVKEAAEIIEARWKISGMPSQLSLQPFAHLSSGIQTDSQSAKELLIAIRKQLVSRGLPVRGGSFGFHKSVLFSGRTKGYPGSVVFREIPRAPAPGIAERSSEVTK